MKRMQPGAYLRLAVIALFLAAGGVMAAGAPKAQLWERWLAHDPAATQAVDHEPWSRFLQRYVLAEHPSGISRVRYAEVTEGDRRLLQGYLEDLQAVRVSQLNRDEQRAFWINLYNALTVELILGHYPVGSITKINPARALFARGPWDAELLEVEGQALSLNDVEHRILRPIWRDPRIHYAVNCASLGCPNLQAEAFTAANAETLLDRGAREYVNHPRGARLERGRLVLSSIYDWFQEDFGATEQGVLRHLSAYAEGELRGILEGYSGRIGYDYDWSLNEP